VTTRSQVHENILGRLYIFVFMVNTSSLAEWNAALAYLKISY